MNPKETPGVGRRKRALGLVGRNGRMGLAKTGLIKSVWKKKKANPSPTPSGNGWAGGMEAESVGPVMVFWLLGCTTKGGGPEGMGMRKRLTPGLHNRCGAGN